MKAPVRKREAVLLALEERLLALRDEIRQAGGQVNLTRRMLRPVFWAPFSVVVAICAFGLAANPLSISIPYWANEVLSWVVFRGGAVLIVAAPLLFLTPGFQRRAMRQRLRDQTRTIPPEQLSETLAALRSDPDPETRRMAGDLLRDLELRTEMTPSRAPDGGGLELSVTGRRGE